MTWLREELRKNGEELLKRRKTKAKDLCTERNILFEEEVEEQLQTTYHWSNVVFVSDDLRQAEEAEAEREDSQGAKKEKK